MFFIFRKVDYPILKKTRIGGERYIREIYPELEIRYPDVDVNRDNAECIVSDFYSDSVYGNSDDNSDTMRRINIIAYSMPELFKDKDIEKFSLRAANASIIIINDKATINNNVYGGGNYGATGVSSSSNTSYTNIIINDGFIEGSVYRGGNQNGRGSSSKTATVNITMNNGNVVGSIYG